MDWDGFANLHANMYSNHLRRGVTNNPGAGSQAWQPNRTFSSRTDGDVSLYFLTPNHISYTAPVGDPWFTAHFSYQLPVGEENSTFYNPDFFVNVLSCMEQHQVILFWHEAHH
jgi:hypothetical protein